MKTILNIAAAVSATLLTTSLMAGAANADAAQGHATSHEQFSKYVPCSRHAI